MSTGMETRWVRLMIRTLHEGKDRGKKTPQSCSVSSSGPLLWIPAGIFSALCQAHERKNMLLLRDMAIKLPLLDFLIAAMAQKTDISRGEICLGPYQWITKNKLTSRVCDKEISREQLKIWTGWKWKSHPGERAPRITWTSAKPLSGCECRH